MEGLIEQARDFDLKLSALKTPREGWGWYPYGSMSNMVHLQHVLPAETMARLHAGSMGWRVLDIGAADGDFGFFVESLGCEVDFLDNAPTNFNGCAGIKAMAAQLDSPSRLIELDIDRGFTLEREYDLVMALGLLYHLRNPMSFLLRLALHGERMVLSTRVAKFLPDGTAVGHAPVAYLLDADESNGDATNYWVFSPVGLVRALKRCGWVVKAQYLAGSERSNPADNDADQRMFVYCERVENWRDLGIHHTY